MAKSTNTKNEILNVSLKLFSENGFHGASIRDIAKDVGRRESAIYNHFKSKEAIFEQIISDFGKRNFGEIVITDKLINNISKPEKFFYLLSENLLTFWNTDRERMFIKILMSKISIGNSEKSYTLESYLADFRKLCEFIFKEMIKHKFINKFDIHTLSKEFISPLFLIEIERILGIVPDQNYNSFLKNHVEFFWNAVKR